MWCVKFCFRCFFFASNVLNFWGVQLAKASTGNVLLELLNPLVVFRFHMPPMEEREELIDALNVWLCTMLNRSGEGSNIIGCDATTIPMQGVCLHFSPYDSLRSNSHYSNADVDLFVDRLTNFVVSTILTRRNRRTLHEEKRRCNPHARTEHFAIHFHQSLLFSSARWWERQK